MKWTKLKYGKWPEGEIVMRIKDDKAFVHYEIGVIEIWELDREAYFIEKQEGIHTKLSIDSFYDLEPHYIELDKVELPE